MDLESRDKVICCGNSFKTEHNNSRLDRYMFLLGKHQNFKNQDGVLYVLSVKKIQICIRCVLLRHFFFEPCRRVACDILREKRFMSLQTKVQYTSPEQEQKGEINKNKLNTAPNRTLETVTQATEKQNDPC